MFALAKMENRDRTDVGLYGIVATNILAHNTFDSIENSAPDKYFLFGLYFTFRVRNRIKYGNLAIRSLVRK